MKKVAVLFIFFFGKNIFSATWGILPVNLLNISTSSVTYGPELFPSNELNSREIARVMRTYLKISGFSSVISSSKIETALETLKISLNRKLTADDLNQICLRTGADRLLISSIISTEEGEFQFESRIFYAESRQLTDRIANRSEQFWMLISQHLSQRFSNIKPPSFIGAEASRPLLFAVDATGKNYIELQDLKQNAGAIKASFSGICALNGQYKISYSKLNEHPASVKHFLSKLKIAGGSENRYPVFLLADCLQKIHPNRNTPEDRPVIILNVASAPKNANEKIKTKAAFRQLVSKSDLIIMGSGTINEEDRSFWVSLSDELKQLSRVVYSDIIYAQKAGFSDAEEWYILKKGFSFLESKKPVFNEQAEVSEVPAQLKKNFTPQNILDVFSKISGKKVISKIEMPLIFFSHQIASFYNQKRGLAKHEKEVRVLIDSDKSAIWVSLPYDAVFKSGSASILNVGEEYYFLVNIENSGLIENSSGFGEVITNAKEIPRILEINPSDFLRKQKRYLKKSIGGSSIYILRGKVKIIRIKNSFGDSDESP